MCAPPHSYMQDVDTGENSLCPVLVSSSSTMTFATPPVTSSIMMTSTQVDVAMSTTAPATATVTEVLTTTVTDIVVSTTTTATAAVTEVSTTTETVAVTTVTVTVSASASPSPHLSPHLLEDSQSPLLPTVH